MNKIWGMIVISLGMSGVTSAVNQNPTEEWQHIIEATKKLSADKEMQQAVQATITALQNMLSLGLKKITRQVSPTEKEKIVGMIQLINRMVDICGDSARSGVAIDSEAADELRQLGQELMVLVMPLMFLAQDPAFANEQAQLLQDIRLPAYNNVKRIINQLNNELQSK